MFHPFVYGDVIDTAKKFKSDIFSKASNFKLETPKDKKFKSDTY